MCNKRLFNSVKPLMQGDQTGFNVRQLWQDQVANRATHIQAIGQQIRAPNAKLDVPPWKLTSGVVSFAEH